MIKGSVLRTAPLIVTRRRKYLVDAVICRRSLCKLHQGIHPFYFVRRQRLPLISLLPFLSSIKGRSNCMATESESSASPEQATLRRNAIGLPGVLFQSITTMAPASAVAFSLGAAIPFAGGALPLAVLFALVICVLVALNIGSMAKYLPSAGGYFSYVTHGLGP